MGNIKIIFEKNKQTTNNNNDEEEEKTCWEISNGIENNVFIHCSSPGPFNELLSKYGNVLYPSNDEMNLQLLFAPPVTISMSCLAYLEACKENGNLDIDIGKQLLLSSSKGVVK